MRAKLTLNELHQIKWLTGSVLTLLALWALSSLDLVGFGLNFAITAIIFGAFLKPGWVHVIPNFYWSRFVAPLILVLVLIDFGLGFNSLVAPLMRMVILLLAYRTLALRNRREDLQLLLLCLFSIIVSGAITVSLLFAVQILLFAPIAMIFLLIICLLDRGPEFANYRPIWVGFSFKKLVRRVWSVIDIRVFMIGGLLFAFVVSASTGVFVLIPRFDLGQTIPFMQMDTKPRSGFSDTVRLDSVSEIVEDKSVALRIDMPSLGAIRSLPYWRILVLDRYQSGAFSLSEEASNLRRHSNQRELYRWTHRQTPSDFRKGEQWTFYFEGGVSQYLPLPTLFGTMRFTKEQAVELLPDLHVVGLDSVQKSTFSYQLDDPLWDVRAPASRLENEAFDQYERGHDSEGEVAIEYPLTTLKLDVSDDEKSLLSELNAQLKKGTSSLSTVEYSERVTKYLRTNYRYSLRPDGINGSGDPIVSWITNGSMGHCELYAGAFVLLAREAGYPARMVVGFVGGSWNAVENFFVVRNSDAHAWAEIYDAESDEWLRVDPTPGESSVNPEVVSPVNLQFETGMLAWVDSLRMQWYRRVISFDQDDQVALATSLMDIGDSLLDELSIWFEKLLAQLTKWLLKPFGYKHLLSIAMILGLCFGAYYLLRTLPIWAGSFSWSFGRADSLSLVRRQAALYMKKVQTRMVQPGVDETYVKILQNLFTQLEALRFGPRTSSQVAVAVFRTTRRALRTRRAIRF